MRLEAAAAKRMIGALNIKTARDRPRRRSLSGGNQQKVVLGKWFLTEPRILLLDEPTRGVDVGAKREIYRVMSDFARAGGAVVMISSETDEVLGMADRVDRACGTAGLPAHSNGGADPQPLVRLPHLTRA